MQEEDKGLAITFIKLWQGMYQIAQRQKYDKEMGWQRLNLLIERKQRKNRRRTITLFSAAATILVVFGWMIFFKSDSSVKSVPLNFKTEAGSRSEILLPDSTSVILNAGSELTFTEDRKLGIRRATLSGEAYFSVAKRKDPFIISVVDNFSVKVLGTKFNLNAYPQDKEISTALFEGRVELDNSGQQQVMLSPGHEVVFNKETKKFMHSETDVKHSIGWIERKIYMDNMSFSELCNILERWYGVQIDAGNELTKELHFTGVIQEKSINDVFYALSIISPITYIIEGKKIIVSPKTELPMQK
ncbi:FecR domain-containing protein [uncultured Draconibacterium sp.]|uniref:FecR family protein n=1 Tax=uncultured Draconibacterium sp. TaxID=1573823 RepID=UPI0029C8AB44|nr:FecR domain-containing protein [uncultured Draconibacterium sp.]